MWCFCIFSCNRGGDSDFRIFHFALYSPPVNSHCLDTSVKCTFYMLPISHFIPAHKTQHRPYIILIYRFCLSLSLSLKPNTHRRRDETVLSRRCRRCVHEFATTADGFSQIPTTWQSFRVIGRGSSENDWRNKKTSGVKHKPVRNCRSGTDVPGGIKMCGPAIFILARHLRN